MISYIGYVREYIDDSNFDEKLTNNHAFGDDETNIVVAEFWAKFNEANALADWDKVEGVKWLQS